MNPYERAIEHWGESKQVKKAIEELNELKEELEKYSNGQFVEKYNVMSEMADVWNMLLQLAIMFDIDKDKLMAEMQRKMERTMQRIEKEREG